MPQLPATVATPSIKHIFLPSTAGLPEEQQAWVDLDVGPNLVADLQAIDDSDKNKAVSGFRVLTSRIKQWNFTDDEGKPEPITFENVCRMAPDDLRFLSQVKVQKSVSPLSVDDKKKSSSTPAL